MHLVSGSYGKYLHIKLSQDHKSDVGLIDTHTQSNGPYNDIYLRRVSYNNSSMYLSITPCLVKTRLVWIWDVRMVDTCGDGSLACTRTTCKNILHFLPAVTADDAR